METLTVEQKAAIKLANAKAAKAAAREKAAKAKAKAKAKLTEGAKLKKTEVSLWKLKCEAHAAIMNEVHSLSGAIKQAQILPASNAFIQKTGVDLQALTPAFVLKNMVNVPNFKMINGKLFKTITIKKVKTDREKGKWSANDILNALYYEK